MKYKCIVEQRENFIVEVEAEGDIQAMSKAEHEFGEGNWKETGEMSVNTIEVKQGEEK